MFIVNADNLTHSLGLLEDFLTLGKSIGFGGSGPQGATRTRYRSGREGGCIAAESKDKGGGSCKLHDY